MKNVLILTVLSIIFFACDSDLQNDMDNEPKFPYCGDGLVNMQDEECDSKDARCEDYSGGATRGTLFCDTRCKWDNSYCRPNKCSESSKHKTLDAGEVCDGVVKSCLALGYNSSEVAMCRFDCAGYDERNCLPTCGNKLVEPNETCEPGQKIACSNLGYGNGLAKCESDCSGWNPAGCVKDASKYVITFDVMDSCPNGKASKAALYENGFPMGGVFSTPKTNTWYRHALYCNPGTILCFGGWQDNIRWGCGEDCLFWVPNNNCVECATTGISASLSCF